MRKLSVIILICAVVVPLWAGEIVSAVNHDQALSELRGGNARFVAGQPHAWTAGADKREQLTKGQHPLACVITCSDSRVSPEILFDESLGDLFVVRLAGNVVTPEAVGSIEYAVAHLHVPLVVVLGHSSCGAVAAAISEPDMEGPIGTLISRIKPSIDAAKAKGFSGDDLPTAVVSENARRGAESLLEGSRALDEAVRNGSLAVLSATYDLKSGRVNWLTQMCAAAPEAPVIIAASADKKTAAEPEKKVAATEPDKKVAVDGEKKAVADADKKDAAVASKEVAVDAKTDVTPAPTASANADPKPAPRKKTREVSAYAKRH